MHFGNTAFWRFICWEHTVPGNQYQTGCSAIFGFRDPRFDLRKGLSPFSYTSAYIPLVSCLYRACIVLVSCLKTESLSFSEHNADVCVEKQMFWRDKCHQGHFMNIVFSCCAGFNGCDIGIVPSIVKTHGEFGI